MESLEAPLRFFVVETVEEARQISLEGDDYSVKVRFVNSVVSHNFYHINPGFAPGDRVKITYEKVPSCPNSPTTNPTPTPNA